MAGSSKDEKAGKVGKQLKLTTVGKGEGKEGGKRVTFKLSDEKGKGEREDLIKVMMEELKILKGDRKVYKEEMKKFKEVIKDCEEKIGRLEERIEEMEKNWKEEREKDLTRVETGGEQEDRRSVGSVWSLRSRTDSKASLDSRCSGLSEREIGRFRKWAAERDWEDRKLNIIIKGVNMPETVKKDRLERRKWAEDLIKEKIEVTCKIMSCRVSGSVIIVKLENEEKKKEVMINKSKLKLKGERIFLENDMSWEQRRTQERIKRWGREQKEKGVQVKIGFGRVKIGDIWRPWEEIEREEERREEREAGDREEENLNFS